MTWARVGSLYDREKPSAVFSLEAMTTPLRSTIAPRGRSREAAMSRGLKGSFASDAEAKMVQ